MAKRNYHIWQGRRCIGIQTGGQPFPTPLSCAAWADCMKCDQSIVIQFDSEQASRSKSDAWVDEQMKRKGWTVKPTRCPLHVVKHREKARG